MGRSPDTPIFLMEYGRHQFVGKPPIVIVMYCTPSVKGKPFSPTSPSPAEPYLAVIGGDHLFRAQQPRGTWIRLLLGLKYAICSGQVSGFRGYVKSWKRQVESSGAAFGGAQREV
jgi:hypothetical protein